MLLVLDHTQHAPVFWARAWVGLSEAAAKATAAVQRAFRNARFFMRCSLEIHPARSDMDAGRKVE
jgi:hypothetical protein